MIINAVILVWKQQGLGFPWLGVALAVLMSCAVALPFHILVERPVTRKLHERLRQS